jgi:hypothetical protein
MQEKYIGDERDYVKYALLRHLAEQMPEAKLGVNWYRFETNENHGEKRGYLDNAKKWRGLDAKLFDALKAADFQSKENRKLSNIEKLDIWPKNTIFYDVSIPEGMTKIGRGEWHRRAKAELDQTDLLFLDPNTGGKIRTIGKSADVDARKYILNTELFDYAREKITVFFQYRWRCSPQEQVNRRRQWYERLKRHEIRIDLPVILGSNVLFFTFAPKAKAEGLSECLSGFSMKHEEIKLIS